jgi:hypothetical protein
VSIVRLLLQHIATSGFHAFLLELATTIILAIELYKFIVFILKS